MTPVVQILRRQRALEKGTANIPGYVGLYTINEYGSIFSVKSKKMVAQTRAGYKDSRLKVELYKNGERKNLKVYRLVALTFIPNPHKKPEVNHIDGNTKNNHYTNLEWSTRRENVDHAIANNLMWYQKKEVSA